VLMKMELLSLTYFSKQNHKDSVSYIYPFHIMGVDGWEERQKCFPLLQLVLLHTISYSFPQLKKHKRIYICLDSCRETSEREKKNKFPMLLLPDFHSA